MLQSLLTIPDWRYFCQFFANCWSYQTDLPGLPESETRRHCWWISTVIVADIFIWGSLCMHPISSMQDVWSLHLLVHQSDHLGVVGGGTIGAVRPLYGRIAAMRLRHCLCDFCDPPPQGREPLPRQRTDGAQHLDGIWDDIGCPQPCAVHSFITASSRLHNSSG